jgi:signal transduction histidine kinase
VFGLFVLFDIGLFAWLIVRSLSQRELEKILLETRVEAQGLADRIAGRAQREGQDLYTAIALERETQTYIDSVLQQKDIVQTVEIVDKSGVLVFRSQSQATLPAGAAPAPSRELPGVVETRTIERESTYDVTVPIADFGMLRIGISPGELEQRIEILRGELTRQASLLGLVTIGLLASAYAGLWWLWRRSRRLEEQAVEAERLAYIGTLASGLAHEIRNPLNSLNLNMQLLEEEEVGESGVASAKARLLTLTRGELRRLEGLVSDFLSYARPRPLELEEVPAVQLLEHVRELLAAEAEASGSRILVDDRSGGQSVRVDRAQFAQLLLNLARNALQAIGEAGRPGVVRCSCHRQGTRVVLEVTDNGAGIAAAEMSRIFELFYSTRKGGTGLGLAIVDRIARAHDAALAVQSTPGVGTTVSLTLQAVAAGREVLPVAGGALAAQVSARTGSGGT